MCPAVCNDDRQVTLTIVGKYYTYCSILNTTAPITIYGCVALLLSVWYWGGEKRSFTLRIGRMHYNPKQTVVKYFCAKSCLLWFLPKKKINGKIFIVFKQCKTQETPFGHQYYHMSKTLPTWELISVSGKMQKSLAGLVNVNLFHIFLSTLQK